MALSAGTRLGPYEILAPLGAGGMGEVYRAKDTRLDRTVAIKVLPEHVATNPEARQRFEREARAVSSLNHPHICTLHDIGSQDGIDFLVMEYLEGETVAQRLAKGPLPVPQALRYGIEIADALTQAHRHGVCHRDLKPGNIILTKSGAKLLDFGLAKRARAAAEGDEPTVSMDLTGKGTLLGTAPYMAPEQLQGREADARSDIFAFGAVLYEMVAGRRPFTGQTLANVMAAILEHEPPPLPVSCPPALDRVVKRCLAKDPDERWQSAQDLASELKWLAEGGSPLTASVTAPAPKSSRGWMAAAAVLALAVAGLSVVLFRGAPSPQQTIRFQVPAPEKKTILDVALSPDGQRLAFATGPPNSSGPERRLWVRSLDSLSPQPLSGTEGALLPFWSPDSRTIAFFAGGKLKKIDLLGGPAQTLCDAPAGRPGAWNREGVILFRPSEGPLYRVSAAGGEARPVTTLDESRQETQHTWVQFLPDGHHFLYTAVSSVAENSAIHAASLDSKETKRLLTSTAKAAYTQDGKGHGYVLFLRADTLLAQRFDAVRLELQGEPFPVAENVSASSEGRDPANASGWGVFSVSDAGMLASRHGTGTANKELVWFDRAGRRLNTVGEPADYSNPTLAPDEKRLAISRVDPQTKTRDIWIFDLERGTSSRLTFDRADEMNPMWSPDGKRIAFTSTRKGQRDLYVKDASGSGEEQVLLASKEVKNAENWSPDGRYLLFASRRTMALPLEGDGKPLPLLTGPYTRGQAQVSPDGRWLAYRSDESGRFEVYVQSFPELLAGRSAGKWQVSTAGGSYPQWRRDGQELFYLAPDNKLSTVSVKTGGTAFERGIPNALFEVRIEAALRNTHFVPAANGQRFLVLQVPDQRASSPIDVVVNWAAGAQR